MADRHLWPGATWATRRPSIRIAWLPVNGFARSRRPIEGGRLYVDDEGTEEGLAAFLGASRVLILMAPLTIDTRDRFDAMRLRHLQGGSYVINVARGELLVENDLSSCLIPDTYA